MSSDLPSSRRPIEPRQPAEPSDLDRSLAAMGWNQRELTEQYARMKTFIEGVFREAEQQKKRPIILLGEDHYSTKSLMLQIMAVHILSGIKGGGRRKLFYEISDPDLRSAQESPEALLRRGVLDNRYVTVVQSAAQYGVAVHPIEDVATVVEMMTKLREVAHSGEEAGKLMEKTLSFRDKLMAKAINETRNSEGLVLCGLAHCKGIEEKLDKKQYLTRLINLSTSPQTTRPTGPKGSAAFDYLTDPKHAEQITFSGNDLRLNEAPWPRNKQLMNMLRGALQQIASERSLTV